MMPKLKSVFALVIVATIFTASSTSVLAQTIPQNRLSFNVESDMFQDAYVDKDFIDLSELDTKIIDGVISTNSHSFQLDRKINDVVEIFGDRYIEFLDTSYRNGKKLIAIGTATAYYEEVYDDNTNNIISSRLLSENEVNSLNSGEWPKDANPVVYGTLTLNMTVFENNVSNGSSYTAAGFADWSPTFYFNTKTTPAYGDDFIALAWGGNFQPSDYGCVVEYNDGSYTDGTQADISPNAGILWQFKDTSYGAIGNDIYSERITAATTLNKNTIEGNGNTTQVVLRYVHTYASVIVSGSFGPGSPPTINVNGTALQWPLSLSVEGLAY